MKQRIITALIWLAFAAVVMVMNITHPVILNIAFIAIACISLYEVLTATRFIKSPVISGASYLFTCYMLIAPMLFTDLRRPVLLGCMVYFVVIFTVMSVNYPKYGFTEIAVAIMATLLIVIPFFSALYIYWYNQYDAENGVHVIGQCTVILCALIAWLTDTGAYFTGMLLGKHKLAPELSPKKTVEGAVGGVVVCIVFNSLIAYALTNFDIVSFEVNWLNFIIICAVGSLVSMIGDLTFSAIKRSCGIKDFGNIMPGHGGMLDRFDSLIFVFPFMWVMDMFMPIIVGGVAA